MKLDDLSNKQLHALMLEIESDPKNQNPDKKSIFRYTKEANKKLDKIRWAITNNLRKERLARGEYINDAGYSGRQSNKR